jgi:hypothetical protein
VTGTVTTPAGEATVTAQATPPPVQVPDLTPTVPDVTATTEATTPVGTVSVGAQTPPAPTSP